MAWLLGCTLILLFTVVRGCCLASIAIHSEAMLVESVGFFSSSIHKSTLSESRAISHHSHQSSLSRMPPEFWMGPASRSPPVIDWSVESSASCCLFDHERILVDLIDSFAISVRDVTECPSPMRIEYSLVSLQRTTRMVKTVNVLPLVIFKFDSPNLSPSNSVVATVTSIKISRFFMCNPELIIDGIIIIEYCTQLIQLYAYISALPINIRLLIHFVTIINVKIEPILSTLNSVSLYYSQVMIIILIINYNLLNKGSGDITSVVDSLDNIEVLTSLRSLDKLSFRLRAHSAHCMLSALGQDKITHNIIVEFLLQHRVCLLSCLLETSKWFFTLCMKPYHLLNFSVLLDLSDALSFHKNLPPTQVFQGTVGDSMFGSRHDFKGVNLPVTSSEKYTEVVEEILFEILGIWRIFLSEFIKIYKSGLKAGIILSFLFHTNNWCYRAELQDPLEKDSWDFKEVDKGEGLTKGILTVRPLLDKCLNGCFYKWKYSWKNADNQLELFLFFFPNFNSNEIKFTWSKMNLFDIICEGVHLSLCFWWASLVYNCWSKIMDHDIIIGYLYGSIIIFLYYIFMLCWNVSANWKADKQFQFASVIHTGLIKPTFNTLTTKPMETPLQEHMPGNCHEWSPGELVLFFSVPYSSNENSILVKAVAVVQHYMLIIRSEVPSVGVTGALPLNLGAFDDPQLLPPWFVILFRKSREIVCSLLQVDEVPHPRHSLRSDHLYYILSIYVVEITCRQKESCGFSQSASRYE
ncbi:putative signal peptide protein [Puccinia sorghi]|uniref:Putative signal peptide protein n=1 Tax=Puccinia sorghi TaxID=27349 RepID=A0A0L6V3G1_9BASI|nr:putative signal peptide protein [Puccinia sorghi]